MKDDAYLCVPSCDVPGRGTSWDDADLNRFFMGFCQFLGNRCGKPKKSLATTDKERNIQIKMVIS